jgi:hypothetical protein
MFAWAVPGAAAVLSTGCAGNDAVARVVDGHAIDGRFIGVAPYASFLRGALAEEHGDLRAALSAYEATASADAADPAVWTRVGRTRCQLDPHDARALAALDEALRLDPTYQPAQTARASCEAQRDGVATSPRPGARPGDLLSVGPATPPTATSAVERSRLLAFTLLHGDEVAAWDALAEWGMAHGDVPLAVRALAKVAKLAPARQARIGEVVVALAGRGFAAEARELAAALVDLGAMAPSPLVVRLALDEAIQRQDVGSVFARSAQAHVGLELPAGRAWCGGQGRFARDILATTVRADPRNVAARLVYEGAAGRAALHLSPATGTRLPPDIAIPFARDVLAAEGVTASRRALSLLGPELPRGDALLTPVLVELAIAGVVADEALPPDARIELAARRLVRPTAADVASAGLDARHRLLGLALLRPGAAPTLDLAQRLSSAAPEDPLVAVALARVALARNEAVPEDVRAHLEGFAPADPIAAATLLDVVQRGAPADLAHARRRLAALAATPAERARAAE